MFDGESTSRVEKSDTNTLVILTPSGEGAAGLEEAIRAAGFTILPAPGSDARNIDITILSLLHYRDRGELPSLFQAHLAEKWKGSHAAVPMLVIEPPSDEWNACGWAGGYDARLVWPRAAWQLGSVLERLRRQV